MELFTEIEIGKEYIINNPYSKINGNLVKVKGINKEKQQAIVVTEINGKPNGFCISMKYLKEKEKDGEKLMRKWKCISYDDADKACTVGKIYYTNDDGRGLISDNGFEFKNLKIKELRNCVFEEVKDFTKSDLKPCMVVILRNNTICKIVDTTQGLAIQHKNGAYNYLNCYNEFLFKAGKYNIGEEDIVKIYGLSECGNNNSEFNIQYRKLLFERTEKSPQQIKIEEIEKTVAELNQQLEELKKEV